MLNQAVSAFLNAIELNPHAAPVYHDLGVVRYQEGCYAQSLDCFQKAVALDGRMAQAWFNGGNTLCAMKRLHEAIAWYRHAIEVKPDFLQVHYNLANTYKILGQYREALNHYHYAIQIDSQMPEAYNNMGTLLLGNGVLDQALACFEKAIELKDNYIQAMYNCGLTLSRLGKVGRALDYVQNCLRSQPQNNEALALLVLLLLQACDWKSLSQAGQKLDRITDQQLTSGQRISESPFLSFARSSDPRRNLMISRAWSNWLIQSNPLYRSRFAFSGYQRSDKRLTIGYLSERFRNAATAHLTAGIFGRHDRNRFKVLAYSWGQDDGSYYRRKIEADVDQFVDIRSISDFEAANRIHADGVDILIDMMGWMHGHRMGILAQRPAPIQVNYLGYPSTTGAPFMDYILADRVVIPPEQRQYYSEEVVWLPDCYQPNDPQTPLDERKYHRREYGLPEQAVVFCSFNTDYKIEPFAFEIWMRILRTVPESVLWLLVRSVDARENLCRAAGRLGIDSNRLVFASPLPKEKHIARLKLADLALDTFTVNGHTTTSDALLAGIPVITCQGTHFASRAAGSMLRAVGLNELVTCCASDYEQLAVRLAVDRSQRMAIMKKLDRNKQSYPLFDIDRFVQQLEAAYLHMWHSYSGYDRKVREGCGYHD